MTTRTFILVDGRTVCWCCLTAKRGGADIRHVVELGPPASTCAVCNADAMDEPAFGIMCADCADVLVAPLVHPYDVDSVVEYVGTLLDVGGWQPAGGGAWVCPACVRQRNAKAVETLARRAAIVVDRLKGEVAHV